MFCPLDFVIETFREVRTNQIQSGLYVQQGWNRKKHWSVVLSMGIPHQARMLRATYSLVSVVAVFPHSSQQSGHILKLVCELTAEGIEDDLKVALEQ